MHTTHFTTRTDSRGSLTVADHELPFPVRRIFYIHGVPEGQSRGGHRHVRTRLALVCVHGSCKVHIDNGELESDVSLDRPDTCLVLEPRDWHRMTDFSPGAVLLVLASESYDPGDYIYTAYR